MNVEQRLVNALRATDRIEPSPDLWSRVVHSIEEDRAHRRRVVTSFAVTIAVIIGLVVVGMLNLIDTPSGQQVRVPAMELIETIALISLVAVLGPAIRRFGRGYADDLWPTTPTMPLSLLRLLDVAYLLVFGGYILLTTYFDFGRSTIERRRTGRGAVPAGRWARPDDGAPARCHDHDAASDRPRLELDPGGPETAEVDHRHPGHRRTRRRTAGLAGTRRRNRKRCLTAHKQIHLRCHPVALSNRLSGHGGTAALTSVIEIEGLRKSYRRHGGTTVLWAASLARALAVIVGGEALSFRRRDIAAVT